MTPARKRRSRPDGEGARYPRPHVARAAHLLARYRISTSPRAAQRQIERAREVLADLSRIAATDTEVRAWLRGWIAPTVAACEQPDPPETLPYAVQSYAAADGNTSPALTRWLQEPTPEHARRLIASLRLEQARGENLTRVLSEATP